MEALLWRWNSLSSSKAHPSMSTRDTQAGALVPMLVTAAPGLHVHVCQGPG